MKYYSVTVHGGECNSYRLRHDSDVNGHEYRPTVCVSGARGDDNQVHIHRLQCFGYDVEVVEEVPYSGYKVCEHYWWFLATIPKRKHIRMYSTIRHWLRK